LLARGVYHGSRPLASRDGRIYVERGTPGAWPTPDEARQGRLRTDAITLDAIDPETGAQQTLYASRGYPLHLARELDADSFLYRVAFEGADLLASDRASGAARLVAEVAPYARDFSVDAARGALVMGNRDGASWTVERVSVVTGAREVLYASPREAPS